MEYLAIKNWKKFQSAKKNCTWIKDYTEKDFDPEFGTLTLAQKGMLDACCRLRARRGCNLPNDPLWICSAVAIRPQERHNAVTAIRQLIGSGFLVLTNEQDTPLEERRGEEKRVEKEAEDAAQLPDLQLSRKVIEELALTCDSRMMGSVAGAITFCRKIEGKSANAAVEFLIAHGKDEIERGRAPTKFWFDDRKWRTGEGVNGHGQKQSALDRNREALRKATSAASS